MELDYALLADAAQVAQGKTYILGGGASILWRTEFPAPLGISLVAQLTYERTEADSTHRLRVVVMDEDGAPILPDVEGEFHVPPAPENVPRNLSLVAPIVIGFPPAPVLQAPGAYAVQILLDGRHLKTLPFAVDRPPEPEVA